MKSASNDEKMEAYNHCKEQCEESDDGEAISIRPAETECEETCQNDLELYNFDELSVK